MSNDAGKHKQRYVYHPSYQSKLTWIIHGPGNLMDECKFLNDFDSNHTKIGPSKELRQDTEFNKSLENSKRIMIWSNMQLMISSCRENKN